MIAELIRWSIRNRFLVLLATGFLVAGPHDVVKSPDINLIGLLPDGISISFSKSLTTIMGSVGAESSLYNSRNCDVRPSAHSDTWP